MSAHHHGRTGPGERQRPTAQAAHRHAGRCGQVFRYLALVISAVLFLLPFYLIVRNAMSGGHRDHRARLDAVPKTIHWENFTELFTDPSVNIVQSLMNSAIVAVLQTAGMLLVLLDGRLRSGADSVPVGDADLLRGPGHLDDPAGGDVHPVIHHRLPAAMGGHVPGDHRAGAVQRLHHVLVPPVLPQLSAQSRGGGAGGRVGVLRRLLADSGAQLRCVLRGDRSDHLHRQLERVPVAAGDRAGLLEVDSPSRA